MQYYQNGNQFIHGQEELPEGAENLLPTEEEMNWLTEMASPARYALLLLTFYDINPKDHLCATKLPRVVEIYFCYYWGLLTIHFFYCMDSKFSIISSKFGILVAVSFFYNTVFSVEGGDVFYRKWYYDTS